MFYPQQESTNKKRSCYDIRTLKLKKESTDPIGFYYLKTMENVINTQQKKII